MFTASGSERFKHMIAKKCTRCGKFYEIRSENLFETLARNLKKVAAITNDRLWERLMLMEKLEKETDLCPACLKSLNEWMKEGAKNEQEERTSDGYNAGEILVDELHTGPEQ
jgi:uncharacterized protein with PIN domain